MAKKKKAESNSTSRAPTAAALRRKIDKLDEQIIKLLNERAELSVELGRKKSANGDPTYDPQREEEILKRAKRANGGPLTGESVRYIVREIISGCRELQRPTQVAFLGPEHSYSHLAAVHRFGQSAELVPVATIAAVFEEVEREQADLGLVPIENSTDGRIADTLEMFAKSPVRICGEVPLRIHHHLLGRCSRADVQRIYSKPQALSQCRNWIARHLPGAEVLEVASTSDAARRAVEEKGAAAVAGRQAATNYGLEFLAEDIEDNPDNITRFVVIGPQPADKTGDDKTALMFEVPHQPGALADSMAIFKRKSLNLTWIESFPIPAQTGRYLFFVELEGHQNEIRVRRAIELLRGKAIRLEILGSYARMAPIG